MANGTDLKFLTATNDVLASDKKASDANASYMKLLGEALGRPVTGLPTVGAGVDPSMVASTQKIQALTAQGVKDLTETNANMNSAVDAQSKALRDIGTAKNEGIEADRARAQRIADQNQAINDSFGITDKVVQANQERWAAYEEGKTSRAAAEAVRNVTITEDPLAWLLKGAVVPSLTADADASEANFKAATDVINQAQTAAGNQKILMESAIPTITMEQAAAKAKENAATAEAQAQAINAQRFKDNADFQRTVLANNVNAAEATYKLGAAKLAQKNESVNSQARSAAFMQNQRDNQLILAEKYKTITEETARKKLQDAHLSAGASMLGLDVSKMSAAQLNLMYGDNAQAVRYIGATGSYGSTPLEIINNLKTLNANMGSMTKQSKATIEVYQSVYKTVTEQGKKDAGLGKAPDPKNIGKDVATTLYYEDKMRDALKSSFNTNSGIGSILRPQELLSQVLAPQGGLNLNSALGKEAYNKLNTVTFGVIRSMAKGEAQGGAKSDPQATLFSVYDANRKAGLNQVDAAKQAYGTLKLMADGRTAKYDSRMLDRDLIKTDDMNFGGNGDYDGFNLKYAEVQKLIIKRDKQLQARAVLTGILNDKSLPQATKDMQSGVDEMGRILSNPFASHVKKFTGGY